MDATQEPKFWTPGMILCALVMLVAFALVVIYVPGGRYVRWF